MNGVDAVLQVRNSMGSAGLVWIGAADNHCSSDIFDATTGYHQQMVTGKPSFQTPQTIRPTRYIGIPTSPHPLIPRIALFLFQPLPTTTIVRTSPYNLNKVCLIVRYASDKWKLIVKNHEWKMCQSKWIITKYI